MINSIDAALDKCQRAKLVLRGYEIQKETNAIEQNDEELSIRIIAEYLDQAIESLSAAHYLNVTEESTNISANTITARNSFASRLRLALDHSGMTQTTLAGLIGVSQGTVSALVTGKSKESGIARCGKIAQILGVSADWLRYGEGEMTSFNFSRQ